MAEGMSDPRSGIVSSSSAHLVLDFSGRIFEGTPEAFSLLGSSSEEVLFHPIDEFFPSLELSHLIRALDILPDGAELKFGSELKRRDRSMRPVRLRFSSRPDRAEILLRLRHDRRAEDRLLEEADFGQAILGSCEGPVLVLNGEDRIVLASPACADIAGAPFAELRGKQPWTLFASPQESERARQTLATLRTSGRPAKERWSWRTKGGETRKVAWHLTVYRDGATSRTYLLATGQDLTEPEMERRRLNETLEAEVRERTRELGGAVEDLRNFTYSMAHTLRAPLRAMAGFGRALREDYVARPLDPSGQDLARRIESAAERMDALIQGLLDYGRVTAEKLECAPVSLAEILGRVLEALSHEVGQKSAQLEIATELPKVRGDQTVLKLVFIHLLSNAIKFVAPGVQPRISILAEVREDHVRVIIQDNGIGIPREYRDRIFWMFEQLHPPEVYSGTGIGLAIVKKAMGRMNGRVDFESEPGKGSRFWIDLPKP